MSIYNKRSGIVTYFTMSLACWMVSAEIAGGGVSEGERRRALFVAEGAVDCLEVRVADGVVLSMFFIMSSSKSSSESLRQTFYHPGTLRQLEAYQIAWGFLVQSGKTSLSCLAPLRDLCLFLLGESTSTPESSSDSLLD